MQDKCPHNCLQNKEVTALNTWNECEYNYTIIYIYKEDTECIPAAHS